MDLEREKETNTNTITESEQVIKKENLLNDLPNVNDLLKSEQEIKASTTPTLKGLKSVEDLNHVENKTFTKKSDKKKELIKRRVKVLTGVYIAVASLLFAFVGINLITLAILNRDINSNTNTIDAQTQAVATIENSIEPDAPPTGEDITITLNEPRDYSDDDQELSFLDKLTILFRNLFG